MPRTPEEMFWIEVIAALKLLISAIERHKLGKGKQPAAPIHAVESVTTRLDAGN